MADRQEVVLLTGFPSSFIARRLLEKLLKAEPDARVVCLVPKGLVNDAESRLKQLSAEEAGRVELAVGDTAAMDLGMSGKRFLALAAEVDTIHHCAAVTDAGVELAVAERVNVGGAGEVLELAEASGHCRLVYWSSAMVSGKRRGRVSEAELLQPAGFHSAVEETRYRAETVIREATDHVPITILRPSIVVGDSRSGECDQMEGPYLLILLMLNSPIDLRVPLPGMGDAPLHLVPIDYVVEAGHSIAADPRSIGRSFHIVDEQPTSARRAFELIAQAAGRRAPVGSLPTKLASLLLRTPGLERFSHIPRELLERLATEVVYDARNTRELLAGTGIECPRVHDYLPIMVEHVRKRQDARKKRSAEREDEDPLEG